MKWSIPAKTFLLGEYAALDHQSALVITTTPCFELSLNTEDSLVGIDPQSPAGLLWLEQKHPQCGLSWYDPYQGCGGLGASSAQFIGAYLAHCFLNQQNARADELLAHYYQYAWSGIGLKPSGYDVIAQTQYGCVYINQQKKIKKSQPWPFSDISLFLVHTGQKLPTHHYLQTNSLPKHINHLSSIVDQAHGAFTNNDSLTFIQSINNYHQALNKLCLVAPHSLALIQELTLWPELLAIKGCGALGADVLLLLVSKESELLMHDKLKSYKLRILATESCITRANAFPDKELFLV
jgi:mevalonate kinase